MCRSRARATRRMNLSPDGRWLAAAEAEGRLEFRSIRDGTVRVVPEREAAPLVRLGSRQLGRCISCRDRAEASSDRRVGVHCCVGLERPGTRRRQRHEFPVAGGTGAWSLDGHFVLAGRQGDVISTDLEEESKSRPLLPSRPGVTRRIVGFLENSSAFLFIERGNSTAGLFRSDVTSAEVVRLDDRPWDAGVAVGPDSVLLQRDDSLFYAVVAPDRRSLGEPVLVSTETVEWFAWGASQNGLLASVPEVDLRFRWFSRDGRALDFVGPVSPRAPRANFKMDASGARVVTSRITESRRDLWILDF